MVDRHFDVNLVYLENDSQRSFCWASYLKNASRLILWANNCLDSTKGISALPGEVLGGDLYTSRNLARHLLRAYIRVSLPDNEVVVTSNAAAWRRMRINHVYFYHKHYELRSVNVKVVEHT